MVNFKLFTCSDAEAASSSSNAQSGSSHIHSSPKKQNSSNKNSNANSGRKRRYTVGADVYKSYQKRRRKDDFEPPTVFKLGGNIHDPLNLNGINAGGTNGQATPISSPFPSPFPPPSKEKVEVLIPPNICDPLNLSCPEALNESDLISPNNFIHKRNKRRRTSSENEVNEQKQKLEMKYNSHDRSRDDSFLTRRNVSNLNRFNRDKFNNSERKISPAGSKQNILRFSRNNSQSNANRHHNKDGNKKGQATSTAAVAEHFPPEASTSTGKSKNNKERFRFGNYNVSCFNCF